MCTLSRSNLPGCHLEMWLNRDLLTCSAIVQKGPYYLKGGEWPHPQSLPSPHQKKRTAASNFDLLPHLLQASVSLLSCNSHSRGWGKKEGGEERASFFPHHKVFLFMIVGWGGGRRERERGKRCECIWGCLCLTQFAINNFNTTFFYF